MKKFFQLCKEKGERDWGRGPIFENSEMCLRTKELRRYFFGWGSYNAHDDTWCEHNF